MPREGALCLVHSLLFKWMQVDCTKLEKTAMRQSTDRILTTHTGSLPRPKVLLDLLRAKEAGSQSDLASMEAAVQDATTQIVRKQLDCGMDIINDGEMSKVGYATYVKDRLTGFEAEGNFPARADDLGFPEFAQRMNADEGLRALKTPACGSPIAWKDKQAVKKDIDCFKRALVGQHPTDTFMTAASPGVVAQFLDDKYYGSHEKYIEALAKVMKEENNAIHQAGFILQLDCPDLALGKHTRFANVSIDEFVKVVALHVDAVNYAISDIPPDRVRLHLCWGNYEGPHYLDVPLRQIIEPVFKARVGAISFEAANPRHEHEWVIFKDVKLPPDKVLIPGIIDSTTNYIEHPDLVAQRIVRFAEVVGRENVIAGTDCGFETFAGYVMVDPAIVWAKLKALADGAKAASDQLWRH
jgi:5-methyltetrahydropteroyltriglutamate--homocysteine methyltransferase